MLNSDFQGGSRFGYRTKRRKTNIILNSAIVIVLLLIGLVSYLIFFSESNNQAASKKTAQPTAAAPKATVHSENKDQTASATQSSSENNSNQNQQTTNSSNNTATDPSQAVVTNGGSSSDVQQTTVNPSWSSVGTAQTGTHTTSYDSSSTDWQEMLKAISSATGINTSDMTVWFLGSDKSNANGSIGTVSATGSSQKYRVYIEWVNGQGWKPTKVEKLSGN